MRAYHSPSEADQPMPGKEREEAGLEREEEELALVSLSENFEEGIDTDKPRREFREEGSTLHSGENPLFGANPYFWSGSEHELAKLMITNRLRERRKFGRWLAQTDSHTTRDPDQHQPSDKNVLRCPREWLCQRQGWEFHIETIVIHKLSSKKSTTQNDI